MVRVRESNSEFAGCSQVNKFFKQAIRSFLIGYKDGTLHSRLMQLFLKIKDCDAVSIRGKRAVAIGIATVFFIFFLFGFFRFENKETISIGLLLIR